MDTDTIAEIVRESTLSLNVPDITKVQVGKADLINRLAIYLSQEVHLPCGECGRKHEWQKHQLFDKKAFIAKCNGEVSHE